MSAVSTEWITQDLMIPELLRAAPQTRPVLDRYGLRGCGGPLGPVESLEFFAKAHDVPLPRLLHELRESCSHPRPLETLAAEPGLADTVYRPFFKAGIIVALTLGAAWGAYLLLRIAGAGSFRAVGLHEVNAHGHAQIFGWVGLFVMGFAYQAFPRFKHASLAYPRAAYVSLAFMLAGIIGRSVFEPLTDLHSWAFTPALIGSVLEVLAVGLFLVIILVTWRAAAQPLAIHDYYILSSLCWFLVQAVYDTLYFAATVQAADEEALVDLVATWQGPLREIQIHGFALLMILGVSQRIFPYFYDFPIPNARIAGVALVCLNVAVLGETLGLLFMRLGGHAWAALWYASVLLLAGSVIILVRGWKIYSHAAQSDRSLKFLRAAYTWLFISLAMLVLLPAYQFGWLAHVAPDSASARLGFSHAYYGAIRHAITVGFISLMIVGVAAKVVPTLNGVDIRALSSLWAPFVLLNVGCALRVIGQTMTDTTAQAFPLTGVSGILEVTGLTLWGVHLWRIMAGRARVNSKTSASGWTPVIVGAPLVADNRVGDVLDHYPALLDVFLSSGFRPLANPFFRKTVARFVTLEQACRQLGVNLQSFLESMNTAKGRDGLVVARDHAPVERRLPVTRFSNRCET
jgi:hypothetical protein